MAAIVAASHLGSLAALMVEKRLDRKKKTVWADRRKRPFSYWLEGMKKPTGLSGTKVSRTMKFDAGLALSTWRGDATLANPGVINNHIVTDFEYANFFMAFKIIHDNYKQMGFTILPNGREQSLTGRASKMSDSDYSQLKNKVNEDLDSFEDSFERKMDLAYHLQGTGSSDLVGLNGLMPIANVGNFAGHDRSREPLVQHVVFAGNGGAIPTGTTRMGGSGTYGANGTLINTIERCLRELKANVAMSELPTGRWVGFAGSGFIEALKSEYRRLGLTYNRDAAGGGGKVDLVLMDEDLAMGRMPIVWDPTLDQMDAVASGERGLGLSNNTFAFGGTTAGAGAQAVARTAAGGTVTDVILLQRGAGYVGGNITATIGGGGSAATVNVFIYGAAATTLPTASTGVAAVTKVTVDDDDTRIGQIAYVTVQAAGSGYGNNTLAMAFTDRLYLLYEPSWEPLYQQGLDKHMSVPADAARNRSTEIQCDATKFLVLNLPRVNGIIHATPA